MMFLGGRDAVYVHFGHFLNDASAGPWVLDRHSPLHPCPMDRDLGAREDATTFLQKRERDSAESILRPAVAGRSF
jgi:hypothetical protein